MLLERIGNARHWEAIFPKKMMKTADIRPLDRIPSVSHTKLRQNLNEQAPWAATEFPPMRDASKEPAKPPAPSSQQRTLQSQDLLQGLKEVLITHGEETYRLRLTRNGKLILHK